MKTKVHLLILCLIVSFQSCKAQQVLADLPKIENYTKGELEIKIVPFGLENPISIGKISADGTIHLKWPEIDLTQNKNSDLYATPIKRLVGGSFCKDPNRAISNPDAKVVQVEFLFLYKYGQQVGALIPSTQKGQEHNKKELGTTLNWVFSNTQVNAIAKCSEKKEWQDTYNFNETTTYNLKFKKGWNIVSYDLKEIETWENGVGKRSLPKTIIVKSLDQIPSNQHWHLKYWANDTLLEIEQELLAKTPISKQKYENWVPKNLGILERVGYEVGKKLERIPTTNNINILFEKGIKKVNLTLVDGAGNKDAINMYTQMQDMASSDWRDKMETGYRSASLIDNHRVITEYNEKEVKTVINYNSNGRFLIKVEALNIQPEELWRHLQTLNFEKLIE